MTCDRRQLLWRGLFAVAMTMAPLTPSLAGDRARPPPARRRAVSRPKPVHKQPVRRPPPRRSPAAGLPLVMIDPGHGGKDPGCIGLRGTQEKTVVLAVATELRRQLLATGSCRVAMTRATDTFIPLDTRVVLARQQRAALFLSIHANASPDHTARGASVYTFAYRASDAHSAATASRENRADGGSAGMRKVAPEVQRILSSLMRGETQRHSAQFQHSVVAHLSRRLAALSPSPRHARFAVLRAPDIASVLTEIGFLTNRKDEELLTSPRYHRLLAAALARSVDTYLSAIYAT